MRALVFAAGLGTRLKPFTEFHPKALVEVGGIPMLGRVIAKLIDSGITEIVVNVHHFSDQIVDYLKSNNNFGVNIHVSDESDKLLDTGGGIIAARKWLDGDDFVVHNADILTDFDISKMIDCHRRNGSMTTLLVADRKTSRYLLFDEGMRMKGWTNISTGEVKPGDIEAEALKKLAFGGVHVLSPEIFDKLETYASGLGFCGTRESIPKFSVTNFYIGACSDSPIYGYFPDKEYIWHDIGKPESLEAARKAISDRAS